MTVAALAILFSPHDAAFDSAHPRRHRPQPVSQRATGKRRLLPEPEATSYTATAPTTTEPGDDAAHGAGGAANQAAEPPLGLPANAPGGVASSQVVLPLLGAVAPQDLHLPSGASASNSVSRSELLAMFGAFKEELATLVRQQAASPPVLSAAAPPPVFPPVPAAASLPPGQAAAAQPGQPSPAVPSIPPPSHLNSFPQPADAAAAAMRDAAELLRSVEVRYNPHSPTGVQHNYVGNIQAGDRSTFFSAPAPPPASTGRHASFLPPSLVESKPAEAKKAPTTAEAFHDHVTMWINNDPQIRDEPDAYRAWVAYANKAASFAYKVGVQAALSYFYSTLRAIDHQPLPLYDPVQHGSVYQVAYLEHVLLQQHTRQRSTYTGKRGAGDSPPPERPAKKKTAAPATAPADKSPLCPRHPSGSHSAAECYALKREAEQAEAEEEEGTVTRRARASRQRGQRASHRHSSA